jgi:hypothetical protein
MKTVLAIVILSATLLGGVGTLAAQENEPAAAGLKALDEFMAAFNARDEVAWAATLNFPHVRLAGDTVRVYENAQEFVEAFDFDSFAERYGWDHSQWDSRTVVQSTHNKVHIAVTFSRFDASNKKISTYDSLYIVTLKDARWGTQARSSFAP